MTSFEVFLRKGPSKIDPEFTIGRAWIQAIIELLNKESYLFNTRCFPPPVFSFTPNLDFFGGIEKRSKLGVFAWKKFKRAGVVGKGRILFIKSLKNHCDKLLNLHKNLCDKLLNVTITK